MNITINSAMGATTNSLRTSKKQSKSKVQNNLAFGRYSYGEEKMATGIGKKILYGAIALASVILAPSSCKVVGPGNRGVDVVLGEVQPEVLGEGIYAKWPFVETIKEVDVRTQNLTDKTACFTYDQQTADVRYSVQYNVVPENVVKLYKEIGMDYETKVLDPDVKGSIKDILGTWNSQDLSRNRPKVADEIKDALNKKLEGKNITVSAVELVDIGFSDAYEAALEAKVTAEQEALKSKNRTVQIEEEAKQKAIAAKGEADAIIAKANAEAKAMDIKAKALERNKDLVGYEAVQKWDGKLPTYMMGNSVPFINMTPQK